MSDLACDPGIAVSVFNRGVNIPAHRLPRGVRFFRGDRHNPVDVRAYLDSDCGPFDTIVDFSGYTPNDLEALNGFSDRALAHRIRSYLFISTSSVYALPPPVPVSEQSPLVGPENDYGFGKIQCEKILEGHANRSGMRAVVLRIAGVFGPGATTELSMILEALMDGTPLVKSWQLQNRLSFVSPGDLSGLVLKWIRNRENPGEANRFSVWNFAQQEPVRAVDLIQVCENTCGKAIVWTDVEGLALRSWPASDLVLDTDRLSGFAKFEFQSMSGIVRDVYESLRKDRSPAGRIKKFAMRIIAGVYVRIKNLIRKNPRNY